MAKPDSTVIKRPVPKKRVGLPEPIESIVKDVAAGFGELKRQSGQAVQNVKAGYEKIKKAIKP